MSGFAAVCPIDILNKFTDVNLKASSFYNQNAFNTTKWDAIQTDNAFPKVMTKNTNDGDTFRQITVQSTIAGSQQNITVNLFSIFTVLKSINSTLASRYTTSDLGDSNYWSSKTYKGTTGVPPLTNDELSTIYTGFKNQSVPGKTTTKIIDAMNLDNLNASSPLRYSISLDFLFSLKYEYCYWASLFRQLLNDVITVNAISTTPTFTDVLKTNLIRQLMNAASSVNQRLNDITAIIVYCNSNQNTELTNIVSATNSTITDLNAATTRMNKALTAISSKDGLSKLRSRMVEYNEEKNNYASTLLSLYGFANLVALGLLFYIYKS